MPRCADCQVTAADTLAEVRSRWSNNSFCRATLLKGWTMGLLVRNGEIVTATDRYVADIWCEDETITAIGRDLPAPSGCEVIDASGKYVFPGFIDPHVHIYLPFMGTYAKDTYESASRAALIGGTTTMIEMCCPGKADDATQIRQSA